MEFPRINGQMSKYANDYFAQRSLPDFHVGVNLYKFVIAFV
jgi:hypothetical protein